MIDTVKVVLSITEIAKLLRDGEVTLVQSNGVVITVYFME